ncbi:MAG: hypothetical protein HUJ26_12675 [Planctomycetaceae bacterium]|nr:hypothetical protein [Planctomycetaceae bacterium]
MSVPVTIIEDENKPVLCITAPVLMTGHELLEHPDIPVPGSIWRGEVVEAVNLEVMSMSGWTGKATWLATMKLKPICLTPSRRDAEKRKGD